MDNRRLLRMCLGAVSSGSCELFFGFRGGSYKFVSFSFLGAFKRTYGQKVSLYFSYWNNAQINFSSNLDPRKKNIFNKCT